MENYLKSEGFEEVASNPAFADATSKDFANLQRPRRTTRGITWASDGVRTQFDYSPMKSIEPIAKPAYYKLYSYKGRLVVKVYSDRGKRIGPVFSSVEKAQDYLSRS